ncbi:EamA/RhaT family transporter [Zobellella endophytica]|uniref:EamA/RhaT family transporter n=1 Tax=Zobellella endophytica TaxID=2116700 RepID=A0A2P7QXL2_9GAMM|nr:DMT family transporter [Zobellella endophytica]PSJ42693.1 EamA/RhaT family transporter [Zobellella endophytica]
MQRITSRMAADSQLLAILLLVLGNLMISFGDVLVKLLGQSEVSPYQYVALRFMLTSALLLPFWWRLPRERKGLGQWKVHLLRGHLLLMGSVCVFVSLIHLPLATANAVFYAAPLMTLPLAALLSKEQVRLPAYVVSLLGFGGILVVLNPAEWHWAGWLALLTAFAMAASNVLVRRLPRGRSVLATLFLTQALAIPVSLALALPGWQPVAAEVWWLLFGATLVGIIYQGVCVLAYAMADASKIAASEYSGLIFVTLMGMVLFAEFPAWNVYLGAAIVIIAIGLQRRLR